jgi:predicted NAD/FAD-dependent oxidoreductase
VSRRALPVGVIGAGLAGLAAARALREGGREVVVFDKGRGPGGRASSRLAEPFAFDHGAQYFTARDPEFRRQLSSWVEEGVAARWDGPIVRLEAERVHPVADGTERFVGTPRMSALARRLARGLDVRSGVRVAALEHDTDGWRLLGEEGVELGSFQGLVVALPPAQAAALIGPRSHLGERAAAIELRPSWAVLLGLARPYRVAFDGAFCEGGALSWIARNSSKPGRPAAEAWVLHASPEWTEEHLGSPCELVVELLAEELQRLTGRELPQVLHRDAHRWRFALPAEGLPVQVPLDAGRALVLAGDAYRGGRIEGAYLSGLAAARALGAGAP